MSFKPSCGCLKHAELTDGKTFKLRPLSQRPYPKRCLEALMEQGLLRSLKGSLCDVCAEYSLRNLVSTAD